MASFVIKPKPYGNGWRVLQQKYAEGKRREVTVPAEGYLALGFAHHMTIEQARARAAALNAEGAIDRHRAANAARRVAVQQPLIESAYLPEQHVHKFTEWLANNSNGSPAHVSKIVVHWALVQRLIVELQIPPWEYVDNSKRIYKLFRDRKYSLDYACKLLRVLNQWGQFVCKRQGQFYEPVPAPRGQSKEQIMEAYEESPFFRAGGSPPLTPALLAKLKDKLPLAQWHWLAVSLWFGLRPSEVLGWHELLANKLRVYQPKLVGLAKAKRWKEIALVEPEQLELVSVLASRSLERPLAKTIKRHLDMPRISLYAGRKGFADLMLDRGHSFVAVSEWMGHQTVDRTWRSYKQRGLKA